MSLFDTIKKQSMKNLLFLILLQFPFLLTAQAIDYNQEKGYVANGYDVVAYFDDKPKKGKNSLIFTYENAKFRFSSENNLEQFKAHPEKYIPQFGSWCAYAMAKTGEKVTVNPETYEIRDGKLYLFYNAYFTNTLKKWTAENPAELAKKAHVNWTKIASKE